MSFGLKLKQVIVAILAVLMPFLQTAPPAADAVVPEPTEPETTIVEQLPEEEAPVAVWDISNSAEDDVKMYFYEIDEDESFAQSFKNMMIPMAHAANEDADQYTNGRIVITGEGETESLLFVKWLNYDLFVPAYEAWCASSGFDHEDIYIEKSGIDADGNIVGEPVSSSFVHSRFDSNEAIFEEYLPTFICDFVIDTDYFWETYGTYIPKVVEIQGDVSRINFGAFSFCTSIEEVIIGSAVEQIDAGAFCQTDIKTVVIPESVKSLGYFSFSGCDQLKTVYIKGDVDNVGRFAFYDIAEDSEIYCRSYYTYSKVADFEIDPNMPMVVGIGEEISTDYSGSTRVVYNPDIFFDLDI